LRPIGFHQPLLPPAMPPDLARAGAMLGKGDLGAMLGGLSNSSAASTGGLEQFAKLIAGQVNEVNSMQSGADDLVHQMLTGQDVNQAEVLTAVQKADLAFRMMLQVRNKLIEAYRELQQIQI
jgi:flagellar hook-basal body complex protein FliE